MTCGSGLTHGSAALTHRTLNALRPASSAYRISDQRCIGLAVRVAPSGLKTWDLAFRIRGSAKVRRVSLGRVSDVSLEKARERANELTSAARVGRDLLMEEERNRAVAASRITVGNLIDFYVRRRVSGRLRTAKEIESRLKRSLFALSTRFVEEIRRRDIRELLDAVADKGIEREAEKRRQAIGAMFRWALSQDIVEADPTAGLQAYDLGTPRDRVLTAKEVHLLWQWFDCGGLPCNPTDIMKLQLLLGARCSEISGLCAEEVNCGEWTWLLPAARSKNKRPRATPLVGTARQIIESRLSKTHTGPLFRSQTGSVLTAAHIGHYLLARRHRLPVARFTTHDLRRTMATLVTEMGIALDLIAAVIGHESGAKDTRTLIRHYVRTDLLERKAHVLSAWDERLRAIVTGHYPSEGRVLLLRAC